MEGEKINMNSEHTTMTTCADALVDTEPAVMPQSSDDPSSMCQTMCQMSFLKIDGLLTLILDPELEQKLTAASILAADKQALFQLLPLIIAAIKRIGETSSNRNNFVKLVSAVRNRIVACRGLKLRFLLLVQNDAFAAQWDVRMVHRRHCYASARRYLFNLCLDEDARYESNEAVKVASDLQSKEKTSGIVDNTSPTTKVTAPSDSFSRLGTNGDVDTHSLVSFAARSLLHPEHGIKTSTIVFRLRTVKSGFYGSELVDAIMERSSFRVRDQAVIIAQRLLDLGIVQKAASTSRRFHDDKKSVFQCHFALHRDDEGHCKVITDDGFELTSWDAVKESDSKQIRQIGIQIPMDMIDLQSLEFWTKSIYVRGVEKGYRYGYRAVTHPLYCRGLNPLSNSNSNSDSDSGKDQLKYPQQIFEDKSEDSDVVKELVDSRSTGSSDINDLHQEDAVVGSVVVTKVFSSIARPMIITLRIPIENADLDDDDHHILLRPGLLVKEGDNLMQDLSVEIMFQCFNHIWSHTPSLMKKYGVIPESISYEVFPTSATQGFMEAVTGLTSLKEFDWNAWRKKYGADKDRVLEMIRTTVGSYIGAYIVGGRDRHFDNVLVKDDNHLLHIDFGFVMGNNPPIDGPPIAIAPQMELAFRRLDVWDLFSDMFVDAFMALRERAPSIVRTSILLFSMAGFNPDQIRHFLSSRLSLNIHEHDQKSKDFMKRQLHMSSGDIKTKFKQFSHAHIDPAWYGLLEKGFPPAVAIMKIVDAKDNRVARRLAENRKQSSIVADDERITVKE